MMCYILTFEKLKNMVVHSNDTDLLFFMLIKQVVETDLPSIALLYRPIKEHG